MELQTFFDNFEYMAEAPNGVQKLREMILQLAVQGKLVPQDPNDEPISYVLSKIRNDNKLSKKGKAAIEHKSINAIEIPFEVPRGWEWERFGNVFDIQGGTQPPKNKFIDRPAKGYIRLFQIRDLGTKPLPVYVPKDSVRSFCTKDDVLLARYGASVGKIFMGQNGAYNVALTKIIFNHEYLYNAYIYLLLNSNLFQKPLSEISRSAQAGFNKGNIFPILLPFPPLEEQKRIVAKVDELMALCDDLEVRKQKTHTTCIQLNDASIDKLLTAPTPENFNRNWRRICDNFNVLYSKLENVNKLRQAILQLAVQGKLVPQDPNDEPASLLLEKINAEKNQLAKEGVIKKSNPLPIIETEDYPYKKPLGWVWVSLGQISLNIHYGYTASADSSIKNVRLLRITDIQNGLVNWDLVPGCKIESKTQSQFLLKPGDLLIARTGGTIGKTFLVEDTPFPAVFASYLIRAIPSSYVYPSFLKVFFGSNLYWTQLYNKTSGTGQPNVNATSLKTLIFPLPPIEEQKRIVARVDEFTALCDDLGSKLSQGQSDNNRLVEAATESTVRNLLRSA